MCDSGESRWAGELWHVICVHGTGMGFWVLTAHMVTPRSTASDPAGGQGPGT